MSQILELPACACYEPPTMLPFDNEGLLALPLHYRSEAFAEDLVADAAAAPADPSHVRGLY